VKKVLDNSKILLDFATLEALVCKHRKIIRVFWNPELRAIDVGIQSGLSNLEEDEDGDFLLEKPIDGKFKIIARGTTILLALKNANDNIAKEQSNNLLDITYAKRITLDSIIQSHEIIIEKHHKGGLRFILVQPTDDYMIPIGYKIHAVRAYTISCCINTMINWLMRQERQGNVSK
jgi:hypothetical protein